MTTAEKRKPQDRVTSWHFLRGFLFPTITILAYIISLPGMIYFSAFGWNMIYVPIFTVLNASVGQALLMPHGYRFAWGWRTFFGLGCLVVLAFIQGVPSFVSLGLIFTGAATLLVLHGHLLWSMAGRGKRGRRLAIAWFLINMGTLVMSAFLWDRITVIAASVWCLGTSIIIGMATNENRRETT